MTAKHKLVENKLKMKSIPSNEHVLVSMSVCQYIDIVSCRVTVVHTFTFMYKCTRMQTPVYWEASPIAVRNLISMHYQMRTYL